MSCGYKTAHTGRVGCCVPCRLLFSSDTAFDKHIRADGHVHPKEVGLVAKPSRSHPDETIWSFPPAGRSPFR